MKSFVPALSLSTAILLASTLGLTGCAGFESAAPLPSVPTSISPGAVHGSVFGGHAPIVGARVYLYQAGQGGYASAPTSRLIFGNGADTLGTYVLTDLNGAFNISGDYTCDVGHPVYLAAVAGAPDAYPAFSVSNIAVTGTGTYTIVITGNNLLYPGQTVYLSGLTADASLDGNQTVTDASTTTFTISVTTGATLTSGAVTGMATPIGSDNPAIVNLATLGLCPGTPNQFADTISYVYVNEVSTVATAYAFAGFGASPFLIGAPTTNLQGIKNAALNAAQLYDIQGSNVGSPYDGDTHIARYVTANGKAAVPQNLLNTLGNILAACVDSNNTLLAPSTACGTLLNTARSTGGVVPADIATAAFNIAQNPAGYPGSTSSAWLNALYTLPPANSPFYPILGAQPTDFLVGLQFTAALNPSVITGPQSIATDAVGNFWYTTQPGSTTTTSGYIVQANSLGLDLYSHLNTAAFTYGNVTIDSATPGNAWTGNNAAGYFAATEVVPGSPSYTLYPNIFQFTYANAAVADSAGNVYFGHGPNVTTGTVIHFAEVKADRSEAQDVDVSATFYGSSHIGHGAIDAAGKIWLTSEDASIIARITGSTGTNTSGFPINVSTTGACNATTIVEPEQPAIDNAGKAWIPIYNSGAGSQVMIITPAAGLFPTSCTYIATGAGPYGTAIDGTSNVWVANRAGNSLTEINSFTGAIISPPTNFTAGGLLSGPMNLAIDISGNLFVTNFTGNSIVEVIGAAAPLYGPLGVAAGAGRVASLP